MPVRTAETINKILQSHNIGVTNSADVKKFSVLSNPEFLAEGSAINDLMNPDRVLIGGDNEDSIEALEEIYCNWINKEKNTKNQSLEFRTFKINSKCISCTKDKFNKFNFSFM